MDRRLQIRALLLVSLAANLCGLVYLASRAAIPPTRPPSGQESGVRPAGPVAATTMDAAPKALAARDRAKGFDWRVAAIPGVREHLLAEGLPSSVAQVVMTTVAMERHGYHEAVEAARLDPSPENKAREKSAEEGYRREVQPLLANMSAVSQWETLQKSARYGDLSPDQVESLKQLETTQRDSPDQEFVARLATFLTPAQVDRYLHYNSLLARNIQFVLSSIDVDETVFEELLQAAVGRENGIVTNRSIAELSARNMHPDSVALYRRVLGDERFLLVLRRFDPAAASSDAIYQVAGLSPSTRADLFLAAVRARHAGPSDPAAQRERALALRREILEQARLTPEQEAAFDTVGQGSALQRGNFGVNAFRYISRIWQ